MGHRLLSLGFHKVPGVKFMHKIIFRKLVPKKPYIVKTRFPFSMYIYPEFKGVISYNSSIAISGQAEPEVTNLFLDHIKPGMTCVDIGACIGWFTLFFAYHIGPRGKVYSFEPREDVMKLLKKNIDMNGFASRIKLHELALADKVKQMDFYIDEVAGRDSLFQKNPAQETIAVKKVNVTTLDKFFRKATQIDLMKIDAENAESLILKGAKRLFKENPQMLVTVEANDSESLRNIKKELPRGWKIKNIYTHNYVIHNSDIRGKI